MRRGVLAFHDWFAASLSRADLGSVDFHILHLPKCDRTRLDEIGVSDRATLRGLTQFLRRSVSARPQTAECKSHRGTGRIEGGFCDRLFQAARKSLILNGEMSEWSIEHAWKTNPATLTERYGNISSRNRFNDFPPQNASRCEPVNVGVYGCFRGDLTQVLHSSERHLFAYAVMLVGTCRESK